MFRQMRRNRQLLSEEEILRVLTQNSNGVLGVIGDGGYPYTVPLNYVYHKGKIYFHCAKQGHKIDAIRRDGRVSFTVIHRDTIVSREYTSYFCSVILFGQAKIVEDEEERLGAFRALVEKYSGDRPEQEKQAEIAGCARSLIVGIDILHITGKQAVELIPPRD